MEETVGQIWDRLITRAAATRYENAAVGLDAMRPRIGAVYRALGGDPGLGLEPAVATPNPARRGFLQRVAGVERSVELAWCDDRAVRLPRRIDLFASSALNADLYLWLAALAAVTPPVFRNWFVDSRRHTCLLLHRWPGLRPRYQRLLVAHLNQRPEAAALPAPEDRWETAVRRALTDPEDVVQPPLLPANLYPVFLWLHPSPPRAKAEAVTGSSDSQHSADGRQPGRAGRRRAERVQDTKGEQGLIVFRLESMFSWSEYANLDRTADDGDDEDAERASEDLDVISVSRKRGATRSVLRFDLDLPGSDCDDIPLGDGIPFPEWDHRRGVLRPGRVSIQPMLARGAGPRALPEKLRATSRQLRKQFAAVQPQRRWLNRQIDGCEIDLDAALDLRARARDRQVPGAPKLYRDRRSSARDLACLLLADLSLSTDTWVNNDVRVIDVIRDSLFLFAESLAALRDRFAIYGFSSKNRQHVRLQVIKTFLQPYHAGVRGRIEAIKPGFYTRMGAAIRFASALFEDQRVDRRLLLLLTDGKPNDLDCYEGRYGTEDTRMAVIEARRMGIQPFCVTIDEKGGEYLPHMFGSQGFVVVKRASQLPRRLPMLYANLTGV